MTADANDDVAPRDPSQKPVTEHRAVRVATATPSHPGRYQVARRPGGWSVRATRHGQIAGLQAQTAEYLAMSTRADVVVLHRVVCCYPGRERLLFAVATGARQYLVVTNPPRSLVTRCSFGFDIPGVVGWQGGRYGSAVPFRGW